MDMYSLELQGFQLVELGPLGEFEKDNFAEPLIDLALQAARGWQVDIGPAKGNMDRAIASYENFEQLVSQLEEFPGLEESRSELVEI